MFGTASWMRISVASSPATHEEEQAGDDVHDAEPLVVDGDDPLVQAFDHRQPLLDGLDARQRVIDDGHMGRQPADVRGVAHPAKQGSNFWSPLN